MNYEPEMKEANEIEDILQHWGVKGMKWKKKKKKQETPEEAKAVLKYKYGMSDKDKKLSREQSRYAPNEIEEILQHFGVKGMRWGVRRDLKRQGYNKKQIKYMNKQYKRDNEFGQRSTQANKRAAKAVSKGKVGLEVAGDPRGVSRRKWYQRTPVLTGIPKRKIEKALDRPLSDFPYRNRRKAQKLIAKYKNVTVRVVTDKNINTPYDGWRRA